MNIYIKEVAKRYGLTLTELGDRLRVSRQTIHYYIEQGDKNPMSQLEKIANAIGCTIEELFRNETKSDNISCPHCGKPLSIKIE